MCGRYVLDCPLSVIAEQFGASLPPDPSVLGAAAHARWNIAPGSDILVIGQREGRPALAALRWGLVPRWARDPAIGNRLANARSEAIATKPSFRAAFRRRRCLVPASGFYEWQQRAGAERKQPWFMSATDGQLLAMAGLWEFWRRPEDSDSEMPQSLRTVCLITTEPNALMAPIHDRMPVLLSGKACAQWLDPDTPPQVLEGLLSAAPEGFLQAWPVSRAVSKASHDGPELIAPVSLQD
jgi:putative SOS response-associated peptidase YedK